MELSYRETMALVHGIILGAFILVAFTGGLAEMWNLRTVTGAVLVVIGGRHATPGAGRPCRSPGVLSTPAEGSRTR